MYLTTRALGRLLVLPTGLSSRGTYLLDYPVTKTTLLLYLVQALHDC